RRVICVASNVPKASPAKWGTVIMDPVPPLRGSSMRYFERWTCHWQALGRGAAGHAVPLFNRRAFFSARMTCGSPSATRRNTEAAENRVTRGAAQNLEVDTANFQMQGNRVGEAEQANRRLHGQDHAFGLLWVVSTEPSMAPRHGA